MKISGIPRLREFCYRIRANALHAAADKFLNASLRGLVRSLELWYEASGQTGTQSLRTQVDTVDMQNVSLVSTLRSLIFNRLRYIMARVR